MRKRILRIGALGAWAGLFLFLGAQAGQAIDKRKEARQHDRARAAQELKISEVSVEGSSSRAYRVETILDVDVETAAYAAMQILVTPSRAPENQVRRMVRSGGGVYVVYTMIDVPFAADRDILVRVEETREDPLGSRGFVWRATQDADVPPVDGVVRITRSDGFWRFTPLSSGGTRAVYQNHTEIGGSIPGWLLHSMLRDEAEDQIEVLRASIGDVRRASRDVAGAPPAKRDLAPQ